MFLDKLTKEQVVNLEMATGAPVIYTFEAGKWHKDA
jgi:bisphosphoglycerate-dependent phosphoglycerate mutase